MQLPPGRLRRLVIPFQLCAVSRSACFRSLKAILSGVASLPVRRRLACQLSVIPSAVERWSRAFNAGRLGRSSVPSDRLALRLIVRHQAIRGGDLQLVDG